MLVVLAVAFTQELISLFCARTLFESVKYAICFYKFSKLKQGF